MSVCVFPHPKLVCTTLTEVMIGMVTQPTHVQPYPTGPGDIGLNLALDSSIPLEPCVNLTPGCLKQSPANTHTHACVHT